MDVSALEDNTFCIWYFRRLKEKGNIPIMEENKVLPCITSVNKYTWKRLVNNLYCVIVQGNSLQTVLPNILYSMSLIYIVALGGLVVFMLSTRPKAHRLKPCQGQWIFKCDDNL